jgi:hypothetical protein
LVPRHDAHYRAEQLSKELLTTSQVPALTTLAADLDRVRWHLWHGNVFRALQITEWLWDDLEITMEEVAAAGKLAKAMREFHGYITANRAFIPNYGDRHRHGETISTAFVESTVNQVISKRFVKKQQMRWTKRGAHLLLQVRTQVLDDDPRETFRGWYPGMQSNTEMGGFGPVLAA